MNEKGEAFRRYLIQVAAVDQSAVRVYLNRVRRFPEDSVRQALNTVRHYWHWLDQSRIQTRIDSVPAKKSQEQLLDAAPRQLRLQHRSYRTEQTYLGWMRRFLDWLPAKGGAVPSPENLRHYLSFLAVERGVAAANQEQAFNALLYLYRHVLNIDVTGLDQTLRSRRPQKLPVVLTRAEVSEVIARLRKPYSLMARLIYGVGLRLREHLEKVEALYREDRRNRRPGVALPSALARKYPKAAESWP